MISLVASWGLVEKSRYLSNESSYIWCHFIAQLCRVCSCKISVFLVASLKHNKKTSLFVRCKILISVCKSPKKIFTQMFSEVPKFCVCTPKSSGFTKYFDQKDFKMLPKFQRLVSKSQQNTKWPRKYARS